MNPGLSLALEESTLPEGKKVDGQNMTGMDNRILATSADNVGGSESGAEDNFPTLEDCGSEEIGDQMPGLMDPMMVHMTESDSVTDSTMAATATERRANRGGSNDVDTKRKAVDMAGDRESEWAGQWKRRCSKDTDLVSNFHSPLHPEQPPSGPFVVESQFRLRPERLNGETQTDCITTLGTGAQVDSSTCEESGLEGNPFFGHSLPLDSWYSSGISASILNKFTLKKIALDNPTATNTALRQQKVRNDLTLADKVRLISISESTGRSQRSLAAEFNISVGSVNNILRRKQEYREAFENKDMASSTKTSGSYQAAPEVPAASDLKRLVRLWLNVAKVKVKPLTWPMVLCMANQFATRLKMVAPSPQLVPNWLTWLHIMQEALDIPPQTSTSSSCSSPSSSSPKGSGPSSESEVSMTVMWRKMLPFLLQGYQPENVFTVTETTLLYKCLPDTCYVGGPFCQNCNHHLDILEHRLTVLLCCNILGERLKPLVVSRYACPPSMRSVAVSDLPVVWCHHPDAVMTADTFAGWLCDLESSMAQQRRQIALFLEMSPSHLSSNLLQHISLKFYLDNCAHLLQPLNRGIVHHFKAFFRRRLLQTALAHQSTGVTTGIFGRQGVVRAVTELDAVFWIQDAWRTVSLETIRTSFLKATFPLNHPHPSSLTTMEPRTEPLPNDFLHLVQEAGQVFRFTPMAATLYAEFDSQLPCHPVTDMEDWERTLLAEATCGFMPQIKKEPDVFADDGSFLSGKQEEWDKKSVSPSEALESLSILKQFSANNIGLLTTVFELESVLLDSIGPSTQI